VAVPVRWILDDGPFDALASLVEPSSLALYTSGRLIVAPTTARETRRSSSRARFLEATTQDGRSLVEVFDLLVEGDDAAGNIFLELHGEEKTTNDRAERESIAWALAHAKDAILVLEDRRAALTALAELGCARVAHSFDLWIDLFEEGVITATEFQGLCERTKRRDSGLNRMPERVTRRLPGE